MQFYFALPKNIRLNSTHYFIMTIKEFIDLYKKCNAKSCTSLVVNDTTFASDNPIHFNCNLLERI